MKSEKFSMVRLNRNEEEMNLITYIKHVFYQKFYQIIAMENFNLPLRAFMGIFLLWLLFLLFIMGPIALTIAGLIVETICFAEIISIYLNVMKLQRIRFFVSIAAYLYIVVNYFLFASLLINQSACIEETCDMLFNYNSSYHICISVAAYLTGFIYFVANISTDNIMDYLSFYSFLHTVFIIISISTHLAINNVLYGRFWIIIPILLTNLNDILAYTFGKLFGKTPLIQISPKKTWEGFIGAAIFTVLLAHFIAKLIHIYDLGHRFFLPGDINKETDVNEKYADLQNEEIQQYYIHVMIMSLCASFIAPFGGFFASAFKRAFGVKNFSNIIPGHGGLLDRYDCQVLMVLCVNIYIRTFVRDNEAELAFLSSSSSNVCM